MRVLCTFPGKHGDLLWALPTVRAIAETIDAPVSLLISPWIQSLAPLVQQQGYVERVWVDETWATQDTAPMTPIRPPSMVSGVYDVVLHLGYRGWPREPLPYEVQRIARSQWHMRAIREIDLSCPWITARPSLDPAGWHPSVVIGFTDEWFELKFGLAELLDAFQPFWIGDSPRWDHEAGYAPTDWLHAVEALVEAQVCVADCSAVHVLAVAMGKRVIVVEPNPHRHHPIFYPLANPRVQLLTGNDGHPTFDARHLVDAVKAALVGKA